MTAELISYPELKYISVTLGFSPLELVQRYPTIPCAILQEVPKEKLIFQNLVAKFKLRYDANS